MKEYMQIVNMDGDELEAIWCHEPQSDIPEMWTLVSVDGWDERSCPDEIWIAADLALDPTQMTEVHPDMDFEGMIEEEERLKNGW
jgi:hypothetical protein